MTSSTTRSELVRRCASLSACRLEMVACWLCAGYMLAAYMLVACWVCWL